MDLIACARYRVIDERKSKDRNGDTHIIFIAQVPRVNGGTLFASFQGGLWVSAHIDDLHVSHNIDKVLEVAFSSKLHGFFKFLVENNNVPIEFNPCLLVRDIIHLAVTSVRLSSDQIHARREAITFIILKLIPDQNPGRRELGKFINTFCSLA